MIHWLDELDWQQQHAWTIRVYGHAENVGVIKPGIYKDGLFSTLKSPKLFDLLGEDAEFYRKSRAS